MLGIPRGGVITAAVLARELNAEMDVALSRKLRHPLQLELAIGAVSEDGDVYLDATYDRKDLDEDFLERFRRIRPAARIADRSVIVTDDGIATGSTMAAALRVVKAKGPRQLILAVPVAAPARLEPFRDECDHVVALLTPDDFLAIGQFYEDFEQVDDQRACEVLEEFAPSSSERRLQG